MLVSSSPCSETCRCNEHAQNFDIKAAVDEPPHWKHRTTQQRRSRQQRKRSPTRAGPKVRLKANRGPSTSRSSCLRNQLRVQRSPENEATSLAQKRPFHSLLKTLRSHALSQASLPLSQTWLFGRQFPRTRRFSHTQFDGGHIR